MDRRRKSLTVRRMLSRSAPESDSSESRGGRRPRAGSDSSADGGVVSVNVDVVARESEEPVRMRACKFGGLEGLSGLRGAKLDLRRARIASSSSTLTFRVLCGLDAGATVKPGVWAGVAKLGAGGATTKSRTRHASAARRGVCSTRLPVTGA